MRFSPKTWAYPLEAVKDRYVARMGGVSYDLQPGEIGVRAEALEENTSLRSLVDRVFVMSAEGPSPPPRNRGESFTVVGLDEHHGDALRWSPHGEVVFSAFETDSCDGDCIVDDLRQGDALYLNATLGRLQITAHKWAERWSPNPDPSA